MRGRVRRLECMQGQLRTTLKKVSFSKTSRTCIAQMFAFFVEFSVNFMKEKKLMFTVAGADRVVLSYYLV